MDQGKGAFDKKLDTQQGLREYQTVAETVGLVPSLRVKDNVIQAIVVAVGLVIGVVVGVLVAPVVKADWYMGAMVGALGGLIIFGLISGGVLMVLGWVRAAKKL